MASCLCSDLRFPSERSSVGETGAEESGTCKALAGVSFLHNPMLILTSFLATRPSILRSRAVQELEILSLRHQIGVLQRSAAKTSEINHG